MTLGGVFLRKSNSQDELKEEEYVAITTVRPAKDNLIF